MSEHVRAGYDPARVREALRAANVEDLSATEIGTLIKVLSGQIEAMLPYAEIRRSRLENTIRTARNVLKVDPNLASLSWSAERLLDSISVDEARNYSSTRPEEGVVAWQSGGSRTPGTLPSRSSERNCGCDGRPPG
jgi:hypothetical protein